MYFPYTIRKFSRYFHRISTFRTSPERGNSYLFHYLAHYSICLLQNPPHFPPLPDPVQGPPPHTRGSSFRPPDSSPPIPTLSDLGFYTIKIVSLLFIYFTANKYCFYITSFIGKSQSSIGSSIHCLNTIGRFLSGNCDSNPLLFPDVLSLDSLSAT